MMHTLVFLLALGHIPQAQGTTRVGVPVVPACTGVTVVLSTPTPRVRAGQKPRFTVAIRNGTDRPLKLLDVREGRRSDLQVNYFELIVARGSDAVDVPIAIADPGPIGDGDFLELPPGGAVELRDLEYKRDLRELPAGEYDVVLLFWRDPFAPNTRCRSSSAQFVVER
jgi:hypothetical protein